MQEYFGHLTMCPCCCLPLLAGGGELGDCIRSVAFCSRVLF